MLSYAIILDIYEIAPYALIVRATGRDPIIPNAAKPIPNIPALANETATVSVIKRIGNANEKYPSARPFTKL